MQVTGFIYAGKGKGVKRLLSSVLYIEHKISIFNGIFSQMKEQRNILIRSREVKYPFKTALNTIPLPFFALSDTYHQLIKVKYVKNAIFENNFEQF